MAKWSTQRIINRLIPLPSGQSDRNAFPNYLTFSPIPTNFRASFIQSLHLYFSLSQLFHNHLLFWPIMYKIYSKYDRLYHGINLAENNRESRERVSASDFRQTFALTRRLAEYIPAIDYHHKL